MSRPRMLVLVHLGSLGSVAARARNDRIAIVREGVSLGDKARAC